MHTSAHARATLLEISGDLHLTPLVVVSKSEDEGDKMEDEGDKMSHQC